jgi:CubicO group peptidase (beta-lactamase class C family)
LVPWLLALAADCEPLAARQEPAAPAHEAAAPAAPTAAETEDLAALLEPIRAAHGVPALGAARVVDGELRGLGVCGVRRIGGEERVGPGDLWHLGSCAKAMTATMCARLVERGLLRWSSTVGEAFADVPMDEGWKRATLEELLAHRGGAPGSLDADGLWIELFERRGAVAADRAKLLAGVLRRAPAHPPGTAFEYSNAGYVLAALMAERASGRDYESLMRAEVFEPLGMTSPGIGAPGADAWPATEPWGHRRSSSGLTALAPGPEADNPPSMAPAGTWHATLADWARFAADHALGEGGGGRLLGAESYRKLHTVAWDGGDYALGWGVARREWSAGPVLTHAGSNTLWYCVAWLAPAERLCVVVTCNAAGPEAERATDAATWELIRPATVDRNSLRDR